MSESGPLLRPGSRADLRAVLALERSADTAPHWPLQSYEDILQPPAAVRRCLIVAILRGEVAGFAVALVQPGSAARQADSIAELESVVVAAHARRTGIGRALCASAIDWCREHRASAIVLEVRAKSSGAIALYRSLGFAHTGTRPRYYWDPEDDACILRLNLG